VLITCPQLQRSFDDHRAAFDQRDIEPILPPVSQQLDEAELLSLIPGIDGVIAGDDAFTRPVLEHADRLRIVSKWGVGTDNIDINAADEFGIRVTNTPGVFGDEVADVVIGYLVLLARRLHTTDHEVRGGHWPKDQGVSLATRTLGIVGLGDIGQGVARRATTMGMRVIGAEIHPQRADEARRLGVSVLGLPRLLAEADVVSLNCPLTADNRHMIDASALAAMKDGVWLINAARGGLVDEDALIDALRSGHLAAAALDVFETEPLPADSPLRNFQQVILGAHNASNTAEASRRTSERAIDNLFRGLDEVTR
jgi:D-3-phosphoglycerate dehydrogenase